MRDDEAIVGGLMRRLVEIFVWGGEGVMRGEGKRGGGREEEREGEKFFAVLAKLRLL